MVCGNDPSCTSSTTSSSSTKESWRPSPELMRLKNLSSCASNNRNEETNNRNDCTTPWCDDTDDDDDDDRTIYNWPAQRLPPEVLSLIVDFAAASAATAGRLAQIDRGFHSVVTRTHPTLWTELAAHRWRIHPVNFAAANNNESNNQNQNNNNSSNNQNQQNSSNQPTATTTAEARQLYRDRHATDHRVRLLTLTIARQMLLLPDYGLEFGWHWGSSFWKRLVEGLVATSNSNNSDEYTRALDGVRRLAREGHHPHHEAEQGHHRGEDDDEPTSTPTSAAAVFPALTRCVATHVLDTLHAAQIQSEWRALLLLRLDSSSSNVNSNSDSIDDIGDADARVLEEGAFLLARSLVPHTDLVGNDDNDLKAYRLLASMEAQLDAYAAQLRARLRLLPGEDGNSSNSPIAAVRALMALTQFQGVDSDDYYNVQNSSLHAVLASKRGIPLTLAVLYKLILRRCHVHVDILGLPGHVVLGVPAASSNDDNNNDGGGGRLLLDVFRHRWLTVRDCMELVWLRGFPWRDGYLTQPLRACHALQRMLNNVTHCLGRQAFAAARPPRSVRKVVQLERAHGLLRILRQRQQQQQQPWQNDASPTTTTTITIDTTQELTLDPQVFAAHGLIDAATAHRCAEASLARALVPAGGSNNN